MQFSNIVMLSIAVDAYVTALQRCNCKLCRSSCCKLTSFIYCLCSNGGKPRVSVGLCSVVLMLTVNESFFFELSVCSVAVPLTLFSYFEGVFFCFAGDVAVV